MLRPQAIIPAATPMGTRYIYGEDDLQYLLEDTFGYDVAEFYKECREKHERETEAATDKKRMAERAAESDAVMEVEDAYQGILNDTVLLLDEALNYIQDAKRIDRRKLGLMLRDLRNDIYNNYL